MSLEAQSPPEVDPQGEGQERRDTQMKGSAYRLYLGTSLPPGAPRDGIIRGELRVEWEIWTQQCRDRLARPHAALESLLARTEHIPYPVGKDLANRLRSLERLSNPNSDTNPRLNPMLILREVQDTKEYIRRLMAPGGPFAGALSPYTGIVAEADRIANAIGAEVASANPPTSGGRPSIFAMPDPRIWRASVPAQKIRDQIGTIAQCGAVLVTVPALAALIILNLRNPDASKRSWGGAAFWAAAALAACCGHTLFRQEPDGRIRLATSTDKWIAEIRRFGVPGGEYERLGNTYGFRDPALIPHWAAAQQRLSSPDIPTDVRKLIKARRPLLPEEEQRILAYIAPGGTPVTPMLQAMLRSPKRSSTDSVGSDFSSYAAFMMPRLSEHGRLFREGFVKSGAGSEAFAALPLSQDSGASAQSGKGF